MELTCAYSRKWVVDLFKETIGVGVWCSPRKGTQDQAIAYVCKEDTRKEGIEPFLYGAKKRQGHRSDLDAMAEAVSCGATKYELLAEFRGNGFRHLGLIDRAQRVYHGWDPIDNAILNKRVQLGFEMDPHAFTHTYIDMQTKLDADGLKLRAELIQGTMEAQAEKEDSERQEALRRFQLFAAKGIELRMHGEGEDGDEEHPRRKKGSSEDDDEPME